MNKIRMSVVVGGIIVFAYLFATPYMAMSSLGKAIVRQDATAISKYVNFEVLRENLTNQLKSQIAETVNQDSGDEALNQMTTFFTAIAVGAAIDNLVTPSGFAVIFHKVLGQKNNSSDGESNLETILDQIQMNFETMDRVSFSAPLPQEGEVQLIMEREGLSWKLVNIIIPFDKMVANLR